jgi:hypothetical protein
MPAPSDINTLKHQYLVQETGLDADSALGELEHAFYTQGMDPDSFTGNAGKIVAVKGDETGLEYIAATTVGNVVTMIPAASRTEYASNVLGEDAWVTISNATLTGAGAKHALVFIYNAFAATDAVAVGEEPAQYIYFRKTGSSEGLYENNAYAAIDQILETTGVDHALSMNTFAIVECGSGGDAGKFDVYFDTSPIAGVTYLATVTILGYMV